jgi:hypothetical protein
MPIQMAMTVPRIQVVGNPGIWRCDYSPVCSQPLFPEVRYSPTQTFQELPGYSKRRSWYLVLFAEALYCRRFRLCLSDLIRSASEFWLTSLTWYLLLYPSPYAQVSLSRSNARLLLREFSVTFSFMKVVGVMAKPKHGLALVTQSEH